ncbi:MAG: squalene/phytoene synthase family protein [Elusimicrobia bacterium]|nr:squalene/phytoene synthase family protein [Elusimicrobiota bacterium]
MPLSPQKNYEAESNFKPAFFFLNKTQRLALSSVYAYCRIVDDITDDLNLPQKTKGQELNKWGEEIENTFKNNPSLPITTNLLKAIKTFNLKKEHFILILDGMKMDMSKNEYQSFDELKPYMYRVASAVAFLCLDIFGYDSNALGKYPENAGYALQLTNIIRDVFEDIKMNRIYLPAEDIKKFGLTKEELIDFTYSDNFRRLMKFETERARGYYDKLDEFIDPAKKKKLFPLFIMTELYKTILDKMEKSDFKSLKFKTKLNGFEKLKAIYKAWRKSC